MEKMDNIITLKGENGAVQFEFLDLIMYQGSEYVILLPVSDESGEVVILMMESKSEDNEEISYVGVEDEETLLRVFDIFKERFVHMFDFIDED